MFEDELLEDDEEVELKDVAEEIDEYLEGGGTLELDSDSDDFGSEDMA